MVINMPKGMTWERALAIAKKNYPKLSEKRQKAIAATIRRGSAQRKKAIEKLIS